MSMNAAHSTVSMMLPISSPDSLLATLLMCAVVLGAALLYAMSTDRYL